MTIVTDPQPDVLFVLRDTSGIAAAPPDVAMLKLGTTAEPAVVLLPINCGMAAVPA
jgi:hypothetical protein